MARRFRSARTEGLKGARRTLLWATGGGLRLRFERFQLGRRHVPRWAVPCELCLHARARYAARHRPRDLPMKLVSAVLRTIASALLLLLVTGQQAAAQTCNFSITSLNFGSIDV